jgi:hypothetical protein
MFVETGYQSDVNCSRINYEVNENKKRAETQFWNKRYENWYRKSKFLTITILDIIHCPVFYLKHGVSETGFCQRIALSIESNRVGSTWKRRQNRVSETSCFK